MYTLDWSNDGITWNRMMVGTKEECVKENILLFREPMRLKEKYGISEMPNLIRVVPLPS